MGLIQDSLNNFILATSGGFARIAGGKKIVEAPKKIAESVEANIKPVEESVNNISRGITNISKTKEILERAKSISDARKIKGSNALASVQRLADLYEQKKGTVGAVKARTDLIYSLKNLPSNEISWNRKDDVNG